MHIMCNHRSLWVGKGNPVLHALSELRNGTGIGESIMHCVRAGPFVCDSGDMCLVQFSQALPNDGLLRLTGPALYMKTIAIDLSRHIAVYANLIVDLSWTVWTARAASRCK